MAGPSIENWVDHLGLKPVNDPDSEKPVYRKPYNGDIPSIAQLDEKLSDSVREARRKRSLALSKMAQLLGLSDNVYQRYESKAARLTVTRLIHICEALDATPEELLAPVAPHLWGETDEHSRLMRDTISQIRSLDTEGLALIFNMLASMKKQPEPMAGR